MAAPPRTAAVLLSLLLHALGLALALPGGRTPAAPARAVDRVTQVMLLTVSRDNPVPAASHATTPSPTRRRRAAQPTANHAAAAPTLPVPTDASAGATTPASVAVPPPQSTPGIATQSADPARDAAADAVSAYAQLLWQHILAHRSAGMGLAGTARIDFVIDRGGRLTTLRIAGSSGLPLLDRLALRAVRDASPFPPPPATLTDAQLQFVVPVNFR